MSKLPINLPKKRIIFNAAFSSWWLSNLTQVQNLYKNYYVKDTVFKAVQDVTLDFPANQIIALLGPSGSGKTTLLRLIAGLESVTDGQIFFGGDTLGATAVWHNWWHHDWLLFVTPLIVPLLSDS